jgi:hypothetical protein
MSSRQSAAPAEMPPASGRTGPAPMDLLLWISSLLVIGIAVLRILGVH